MTNAAIIWAQRLALMEAGIIGTTGRRLRIRNEDGTESEILEPAQIHTFQAWKSLGYVVKKGEHAKARFHIWKYAANKKGADAADEADGEESGRMFRKLAYFFSAAQVEPLQKKEAQA